MARFLICLSVIGLAYSAPAPHYVAPGYATAVAHSPAVVATHDAVIGYASQPVAHKVVRPGPAVSYSVPQTGVVGHQTVQIGSQKVVTGHQYVHAGTEQHQPPSTSYVAEPATNSQSTVPIAPPAVPAPTRTVAGPVKVYGDAPADTVTKYAVTGLGRPVQIITPQRTVIKPELKINKVPVEVPVPVQVPVHREVIVDKPVVKPYHVEVPVPVQVPQPYKVHPVKQVVVNPVIHKHTTSVVHPYAAAAPIAPLAVAPQY